MSRSTEPKLYLVTRDDLPPGRQAAMCVHAAIEYVAHVGYQRTPQTVVMLAVTGGEQDLIELSLRLNDGRIPVQVWLEPDFDDQVCSLAVAEHVPELRRLSPILDTHEHDVGEER